MRGIAQECRAYRRAGRGRIVRRHQRRDGRLFRACWPPRRKSIPAARRSVLTDMGSMQPMANPVVLGRQHRLGDRHRGDGGNDLAQR